MQSQGRRFVVTSMIADLRRVVLASARISSKPTSAFVPKGTNRLAMAPWTKLVPPRCAEYRLRSTTQRPSPSNCKMLKPRTRTKFFTSVLMATPLMEKLEGKTISASSAMQIPRSLIQSHANPSSVENQIQSTKRHRRQMTLYLTKVSNSSAKRDTRLMARTKATNTLVSCVKRMVCTQTLENALQLCVGNPLMLQMLPLKLVQ
mmetsp:Transcript_60567/g.96185  ORF Transcript_60567/g.96185 Transcript_60567/m.96185 type:complete len:204 (+) Transcript_60567:1398-2009(+)